MTIIRNKTEFEKFYTYDLKYLKKSDYPKHYPCVGEVESCMGGLGGDYRDHVITTIPCDTEEASWLKGFKAARDKPLDS